MNTLNFNDADLKANREGRLSDAQMKRFDAEVDRLRQSVTLNLCVGAVFAGLITAGILIGGYIVIAPYEASGEGLTPLALHLKFIVFAMIVLVFISIAVLILFNYWRRTHSLTYSTIRVVEGRAAVLCGDLTGKSGEPIHINRLVLHGSKGSTSVFDFAEEDSLSLFKHGKHYRVYYLPYIEAQALSIEEIYFDQALDNWINRI